MFDIKIILIRLTKAMLSKSMLAIQQQYQFKFRHHPLTKVSRITAN